MGRRLSLGSLFVWLVTTVALSATALGPAQEAAQHDQPQRQRVAGREGSGPDTLPDHPVVMGRRGQQLRITPVKGLERPWALAFLPNGDMLITERPGRLRIVRSDLTLDPRPIAGIPPVLDSAYKGLMDVALHPDFETNRLVYFTYTKVLPGEDVTKDWDTLIGPAGTAVLARGRYDGAYALTDVEDVFVADAATSGVSAVRIVFGRDGKIYMAIGAPNRHLTRGGTNRVGTSEEAQDPVSHSGKVLRLNDDGTVPPDNPFVGKPGHRPEIYALGVRNITGMIVHPTTGEVWAVEHGPLGGDELNIIRAGLNYGWPVVSLGRAYSGDRTGAGFGPELPQLSAPGMEDPFIAWLPSIAPGGLVIYTGNRFPGWTGHLFTGGLRSTQLHRVVINSRVLPGAHQSLLTELGQRIREVREGPDGLLYLLTDHDAGALLRVEPADEPPVTTTAGMVSARTGVYSTTQAERGAALYQTRCQTCHPATEFSGSAFMRSWSGHTAHRLFTLIQTTMPPENVGGLPRESYADLVAYIFEMNQLPAGRTDLPATDEALGRILIEMPADQGGRRR
ncbi:MAG: sorbosone dehydrogenase family protein [Acidobacteria bacterium]|nr:sorbosone dehydrogenase family protein [Acidobacteriota bacterium]